MLSLTGCQNASEKQSLTVEKLDEGLREPLRHGVSIRQASRITGISFGIVRKFRNRENTENRPRVLTIAAHDS